MQPPMLARDSLAFASVQPVGTKERLARLKEWALERLRDEVKRGDRGIQAQLARALGVSTAHIANLVNPNKGTLPGEELLLELARYWGTTYDAMMAEANGEAPGVAPERHVTVERTERYSQMPAVRAMAIAQGIDPAFVASFDVALDADEQPDAEYLYALLKQAYAREKRKVHHRGGDPFSDLDD